MNEPTVASGPERRTGRMRVHELAREYGTDAKTILAVLADLGEYVKSASSTVEQPVVEQVRGRMGPPVTTIRPATAGRSATAVKRAEPAARIAAPPPAPAAAPRAWSTAEPPPAQPTPAAIQPFSNLAPATVSPAPATASPAPATVSPAPAPAPEQAPTGPAEAPMVSGVPGLFSHAGRGNESGPDEPAAWPVRRPSGGSAGRPRRRRPPHKN